MKYFAGIGALVLLTMLMMQTQPHGTQADAHAKVPVGNSLTIVAPPSLTASFVDSVLCGAGSPACGTGHEFYADSLRYGIDDAYALAFFQHESSYGKYGVAHATLSVGNIRCSAGWFCIDGFRAYSSWSQGIDDWYRLIKWYVTDLHRTRLDTILAVYAPSGDNNDTQGYIDAVARSVTSWRAQQ